MGTSSDYEKETVLLNIKKKMRALADADGALAAALAKPGSNAALIKPQLDADALEYNLLDAKFVAIAAGGDFTFPTPTEIQKLATAVDALRADIDKSAAVTTIINDAAAVASAMKASGI
jgi:hypothetical protein